MIKKDMYKLKAGTWIEVLWLDGPSHVCLLLDKPDKHPGDVSLRVFDPVVGTMRYVNHTQVAHSMGLIDVPERWLDEEMRYD